LNQNKIDFSGRDSLEDAMRNILVGILIIILSGCCNCPIKRKTRPTGNVQPCLGNSSLPEELAAQFDPVEDTQLLSKALGRPEKGMLCQGKVYKSKKDSQLTVFRAWNSTNPNSEYGNWWAFGKPAGKIADYRSEYEICYQWSPLDKLASCTLKPETKIVVGTGQSAKCSKYLTYQISDKQQIYIDDASASLTNCAVFDGVFSWK